jgi:para-aminobenzoate synthetase component 1
MNEDTKALEIPAVPRQSSILCSQLPVVEELTPCPDPFTTVCRLAHLPHLLFLDSASNPSDLGRWSFVTADPFGWLVSRRSHIKLNGKSLQAADPFQVLAGQLDRFRDDPVRGLPPFQGGAAGMFGYDLCHHIERLPRPRFDEFETPDLAVGFYDWVIAFDHLHRQAWLISTGHPEQEPGPRRRRAEKRLRQILQRLTDTVDYSIKPHLRVNGNTVRPAAMHHLPHRLGLASSFDRDGYLATIRRAVEYVHAGDCFQVNIAQRLLVPADLPPLELYRRLRQRNPAPFAGYFDLGDFVIASASPERFLRLVGSGTSRGGEVETRPIKGTRPRGQTPDEERSRIAELEQSSKDRAENVMIVDLLRNDLGRVCRYGTVKVDAVCRVETYEYVHHLVSVVRGRLQDGRGPIDLLRAAFPGGSVTGAPKVRAMEIIAELEPAARGPYCGSLGWIGFDGSMDTNLLIRTFTIGRGWIQFPVGGGIVADSVPEQEYEETWHKAEGLLRALGN